MVLDRTWRLAESSAASYGVSLLALGAHFSQTVRSPLQSPLAAFQKSKQLTIVVSAHSAPHSQAPTVWTIFTGTQPRY